MKTAFSFILVFCAVAALSASSVEERSTSTPPSKHLRFEDFYELKQVQEHSAGIRFRRIKITGGHLRTHLRIYKAADESPGHIEDVGSPDDPASLAQEPTDAGTVRNLKWRFSDSSTRRLQGGWVREQVITDLPASHDIAGAQQHLTKGKWGYVYQGQVGISAVDELGRNQYEVLEEGDIWYFPKGEGHAIVGLADENEFLLAFDDGDFQASGTTFNLDDWLVHTPKDIVARSLGIDEDLLASIPRPNPYILASSITCSNISSPFGKLSGNSSYVFRASEVECKPAPRGGGCIKTIDSRNFPAAKPIASSIVTLEPGAVREMHWHPNAEEWLYFLSGSARATVFAGNSASRTFIFTAGDTAVFPSNSGHYIENTSHNETLQYIGIYKSDRVVGVSLRQWLALTPVEIVAEMLGVG